MIASCCAWALVDAEVAVLGRGINGFLSTRPKRQRKQMEEYVFTSPLLCWWRLDRDYAFGMSYDPLDRQCSLDKDFMVGEGEQLCSESFGAF